MGDRRGLVAQKRACFSRHFPLQSLYFKELFKYHHGASTKAKNLTANQMIKQHSVLICLALSVVLIVIATLVYPGGSLLDKSSEGFDWSRNFFSNLFEEKAINGVENPSVVWALAGIIFYSLGYGIFFINMSRKILVGQAAVVLKLIGTANILFTFLIATALHDLMVTISSTLFLLGMFYVTVFVARTKHRLLTLACVISLLMFYYTLFLYGSGDWGWLAIMQKVSLIGSIPLVVGLEYLTNREDFNPI